MKPFLYIQIFIMTHSNFFGCCFCSWFDRIFEKSPDISQSHLSTSDSTTQTESPICRGKQNTPLGHKANLVEILQRQDVAPQQYFGFDKLNQDDTFNEEEICKLEAKIKDFYKRGENSANPLTPDYCETSMLLIPLDPLTCYVDGFMEHFEIDDFLILERRGDDWYYVTVNDPFHPTQFLNVKDVENNLNNALWYLAMKGKYNPNLHGFTGLGLQKSGETVIFKKYRLLILNSSRVFKLLGYNSAWIQDDLIILNDIYEEITESLPENVRQELLDASCLYKRE